jgi:cardiolipin synthase
MATELAPASAAAGAHPPGIRPGDRSLFDRALTRASGAALVPGNSARVLKDAAENYPAWLEAIRHAQHKIYFENYFIVEDEVGREFADALAERARAGVRVRLIYDWLGSFRKASRHFWRSLVAAGVDVRRFNPPRVSRPFEWLHRDHRKMLAVDGRIGFVTGLCVGEMWSGDPANGKAPWRDTGMALTGPALHGIEQAFAQIWAHIGPPLPRDELAPPQSIPETGEVGVRIVANAPGAAALFRVDQLVAAAARRTLWLTDSYFAGVAPYVQALRAAALDGVDVRLLVPGASDIPILQPLTHAGFRPLLEAGVRVFEWKGPMLHAKTGVADGYWSRVGSSNLNIASWLGNYELDTVVEDEGFAAGMEKMYLDDLGSAREIVLRPRGRRFRERRLRDRSPPEHRDSTMIRGRGSASRAAVGALRIGRSVGAVLSDQRLLAPSEGRMIAAAGALLLLIAVVGFAWPALLAYPLALLVTWIAVSFLLRAQELRRERRQRGLPSTRVGHAEPSPPAGSE